MQNLLTCGTVGPARYKIVANFNLKNCGQCRRFLALLRDSSIGVAMASDVGKCSKEPEKNDCSLQRAIPKLGRVLSFNVA